MCGNDYGIRRILVVLALVSVAPACAPGRCTAAFEGCLVDSRAESMGDCWCVSNFPALSLAPIPPPAAGFALGFSYRKPFGLSDLEEKEAVVTLPVSRWLTAFGFVERGGGLYTERMLSVTVSAAAPAATSKKRDRSGKASPAAAAREQPAPALSAARSLVSVSLSLAVLEVSVEGWAPARSASFSVGARASPVSSADVCVGLGNVVSRGTDVGLPQTLLVGVVLRPHQVVRLAVETRRQPGQKPSFHMGAELEPFGGTYLRCGVRTEPLEVTMGIGFTLSRLGLDTTSSFHTVLGRTDSFSLSFSR